ncbi:MAG: trypsin-like peptidase domain-containing protein [Candidatus Thiodiazotropha sp.]
MATDLSKLYERVDPSVVVLHTYTSSPVSTEEKQGLGSGVVISEDGKILTAAHVVHSADSVHVEFGNGNKYLGKVIGSVPSADLAVLQLSQMPENIPVAKLGDSDSVKIGHEVFVIGSPYGLHHTLTSGHISARHTGDALGKLLLKGDFFQTDAAINPGNSGGPLFNLQGEVVGIVSHIETRSGGNEGLGFAVSSNTARELLLERENYWTGITGVAITPELARAINYPFNNGILIQAIANDSFAERIGLREGLIPAKIGKRELLLGGDIIVSVAGITIKGDRSLQEIRGKVESLNPGDSIDFQIYRNGVQASLSSAKP